MSRHVPFVGLSAALLALIAITPAHAEKLSRVEIGKRGKAATAFVEVPNRGSGTAFCVHSSGLFITNEHVIRGAEKAEITLVLNPALESQRIVRAKVVRTDKELDLALLRVEGSEVFPSLPLGSVEGIAELMDVVACGFPLGRALAPDRKEYPAISVNAGSVTSLRLKDKALHFIQIDVALTFGNSGGPVLDDNGKVIGVVVSGVTLAKGINQAIPASRLERFLKAPDIQFVPPELTQATLNKPFEFKARVVSFVPMSPEPKLRLVLSAGDEKEREFPMKKQDGSFVVTTVPVVKDAVAQLEVAVRLSSGMLTGISQDVLFQVGGKPVKLSGVRRIDFKPEPRVLLADDKTMLEGEITGLKDLEVQLADQKIKLDLKSAVQIVVQPKVETSAVTATVIASIDGKEVARLETRMPVRDFGSLVPADPSTVAIVPPVLADEKIVKQLPETFSNVAVGGGGRYLIFQLPKLRKLAVFDVNEARVTKYIPLAEDKAVFTAGLEKVVIGLPSKGALERWSLTTFELETTVFPTFKEEIKSVQMGYGSNGPVVVNGFFLDLGTLRPLPIVDQHKHERIWEPGALRIQSGDGYVYGAWNTHYSPATATSFVLAGGEVKRYEAGNLGHVVPGPDGKMVFTANCILSQTLNRADPDDATYGYCLPAVRGPYFLSLTPSEGGKGGIFTVYLLGQKRAIAKLDKANHGLAFDGWDREAFGPWRRVVFIPQANVIAVLPASNDQIVMHKFDAEAALAKSGVDYLLVTSQPPRTATAGMTFTYPIVVKAKQSSISYALDAGPKGMEVSKAGVVQWKVPPEMLDADEEVIITIKDGAGQEIFHTFKVRVVK